MAEPLSGHEDETSRLGGLPLRLNSVVFSPRRLGSMSFPLSGYKSLSVSGRHSVLLAIRTNCPSREALLERSIEVGDRVRGYGEVCLLHLL